MLKKAFTLAEVLITLTIIGVVAAITLPTFVENMTVRKNSEREANIAQKITQAMEHMRATGKLVHYESTEDFVNELKNHIKITKICDNEHLTDCWPTDTVIGKNGDTYNVADAKIGINMGVGTFTNNVGLILADGSALILNYDNSAPAMDVGDRVSSSNKELVVGKNKTKSFPYTTSVTASIDYITDVNGTAGPNRETPDKKVQYGTASFMYYLVPQNNYFDIRTFKNASFTGLANAEDGSAGRIIYLGKSYYPADCRTTSADYAGGEICGPHPSGKERDYWAGAKAKCNSIKGFHLPTAQELQSIYAVKSEYPSIASITRLVSWSSEEDSGYSGHPTLLAKVIDGGYMITVDKYTSYPAICRGN